MIPFGRDSATELQKHEGQLVRVRLACDMRSCGQDQTPLSGTGVVAPWCRDTNKGLLHHFIGLCFHHTAGAASCG